MFIQRTPRFGLAKVLGLVHVFLACVSLPLAVSDHRSATWDHNGAFRRAPALLSGGIEESSHGTLYKDKVLALIIDTDDGKVEDKSTVIKLEAKLYSSITFRANVIIVFGQILRAPNNTLTVDQFASLDLVLQALIYNQVYIFNLLPVLEKLQGANKDIQFKLVMEALMNNVPVYMTSACKFWLDEIENQHVDVKKLIDSMKQPADFLMGIDPKVIKIAKATVATEELEPFDEASKVTNATLGPVFVNVFHKLKNHEIILSQKLFGAILISLPNGKLNPVLKEYINYIWDLTQNDQIPNWEEVATDIEYGTPYELVNFAVKKLLRREDTPDVLKYALRYILLHLKEVPSTFTDEYYTDMQILLNDDKNVELLFSMIDHDPAIPELAYLRDRMINYIKETNIDDILQGMNKYTYRKPIDVLIALLTRIKNRTQNKDISDTATKLLSILISKKEVGSFSVTVPADVDVVMLFDFLKIPDSNPVLSTLTQKIRHYLEGDLDLLVALQDSVMKEDKSKCQRPIPCLLNALKKIIDPGIDQVLKLPSTLLTMIQTLVDFIRKATNSSVKCESYDFKNVQLPQIPDLVNVVLRPIAHVLGSTFLPKLLKPTGKQTRSPIPPFKSSDNEEIRPKSDSPNPQSSEPVEIVLPTYPNSSPRNLTTANVVSLDNLMVDPKQPKLSKPTNQTSRFPEPASTPKPIIEPTSVPHIIQTLNPQSSELVEIVLPTYPNSSPRNLTTANVISLDDLMVDPKQPELSKPINQTSRFPEPASTPRPIIEPTSVPHIIQTLNPQSSKPVEIVSPTYPNSSPRNLTTANVISLDDLMVDPKQPELSKPINQTSRFPEPASTPRPIIEPTSVPHIIQTLNPQSSEPVEIVLPTYPNSSPRNLTTANVISLDDLMVDPKQPELSKPINQTSRFPEPASTPRPIIEPTSVPHIIQTLNPQSSKPVEIVLPTYPNSSPRNLTTANVISLDDLMVDPKQPELSKPINQTSRFPEPASTPRPIIEPTSVPHIIQTLNPQSSEPVEIVLPTYPNSSPRNLTTANVISPDDLMVDSKQPELSKPINQTSRFPEPASTPRPIIEPTSVPHIIQTLNPQSSKPVKIVLPTYPNSSPRNLTTANVISPDDLMVDPKQPELSKPINQTSRFPEPASTPRPIIEPTSVPHIIQTLNPHVIPSVKLIIEPSSAPPISSTKPPVSTTRAGLILAQKPPAENHLDNPSVQVDNEPVLPPNLRYDRPMYVVFPKDDTPPYTLPTRPRTGTSDWAIVIQFPPMKKLLRGFDPKTAFKSDEFPNIPKIINTLEKQLGPHFIEEILGKHVDKNEFPTVISLTDAVLDRALKHPKVKENGRLASIIRQYLRGIDYISAIALFPVAINLKKISSDVVHVTFDPVNPKLNRVDSEPVEKIPAGFRTLAFYHPKYSMRQVDPVNPYGTLLPNPGEGEDNPIQELINDGSLQKVLGPEFDPLLYPNRGTLLTNILWKLIVSQRVKSSPRLFEILSSYLTSIRSVALYSKIPNDYVTHFIELQENNKVNWQPDTASLIMALSPARTQQELDTINPIKSFLEVPNLLELLQIDNPSYSTTRGAFLKKIFNAALQSKKTICDPKVLSAIEYYKSRILTKRLGALPIVWTWKQ